MKGVGAWILLGTVFLSGSAQAAEWSVKVIEGEKGNRESKDLTFADKKFAADAEQKVELKGSFQAKGASLVTDKGVVLKNGSDAVPAFAWSVQMNKPKFDMRLLEVGAKGNVRTLTVKFEVVSGEFKKGAADLRVHFTPAVGFALNSYTETKKPDYSGVGPFVKVSADKVLVPGKWDLDANAFMTLTNLSTTPSDRSVRFLGINARAGYELPWLKSPWSLKVALGVYYTTLLTNGKFGFSSLIYPQLYPFGSYTFKNNVTAYAYLKYVPTNKSFIPNLSERELASGAGARVPIKGHTMLFSLDFSDLIFDATSAVRCHTRSISVSTGMAF